MPDVVNLRQARKRRRRAEKERAAAENRVRHGRSAAEEERSTLLERLQERRLEGHRRDRPRLGGDED